MTAINTTQIAIDSYTTLFGEPPIKVNTLDTVRHGADGFEISLSMSLGVTLIVKNDSAKIPALLDTLPVVAGNSPTHVMSYANANPRITIYYCANQV